MYQGIYQEYPLITNPHFDNKPPDPPPSVVATAVAAPATPPSPPPLLRRSSAAFTAASATTLTTSSLASLHLRPPSPPSPSERGPDAPLLTYFVRLPTTAVPASASLATAAVAAALRVLTRTACWAVNGMHVICCMTYCNMATKRWYAQNGPLQRVETDQWLNKNPVPPISPWRWIMFERSAARLEQHRRCFSSLAD